MWEVNHAWISNKGKHYSLVSLTNFFQMLYPHLYVIQVSLQKAAFNFSKAFTCFAVQQSLEFRFCAGSNPVCGVLEIHGSEYLWQCSRLENKAKHLLSVNHTTKTIHHYHHFESSRNRAVNVLKSLIIRFMCVCLHSMTLVASSDCNDVCDTHEMYGSTILCCEYILGASAKVVLFRFQIYHISPPKTKLQHADKMEIKRYHILAIFKKII